MKLPIPPSLEQMDALNPKISPVAGNAPRPFWSVMIPTYNSGAYLRATLESVLRQDPGPDRMQIEVVDGGSTLDNPEDIVREMGKGRVTVFRLPENRGPPTTFNACVERARGHWVHMLHGDDLVLPGFYDAYEALIGTFPQVSMVVGQAVIIDENDVWSAIEGPRPPAGGGILTDFVDQVATHWLVTCPSVVVKRSAYEQVGGYSSYFDGPSDWDMWLRLGLHAPVACIGRPLSMYRHHTQSQTKQLVVKGENARQECIVVATNLARIARAGRPRPADTTTWRVRNARWADWETHRLDLQNNLEGRYNQARWAWTLDPTAKRLLMLLKSWLRYKLSGDTVASPTGGAA